jgi:hypothetical protein
LNQITTDVEMLGFLIGLLFEDTTESIEYGFISTNKYSARELMYILEKCADKNDADFILESAKSIGKKLCDDEVCRYITSNY